MIKFLVFALYILSTAFYPIIYCSGNQYGSNYYNNPFGFDYGDDMIHSQGGQSDIDKAITYSLLETSRHQQRDTKSYDKDLGENLFGLGGISDTELNQQESLFASAARHRRDQKRTMDRYISQKEQKRSKDQTSAPAEEPLHVPGCYHLHMPTAYDYGREFGERIEQVGINVKRGLYYLHNLHTFMIKVKDVFLKSSDANAPVLPSSENPCNPEELLAKLRQQKVISLSEIPEPPYKSSQFLTSSLNHLIIVYYYTDIYYWLFGSQKRTKLWIQYMEEYRNAALAKIYSFICNAQNFDVLLSEGSFIMRSGIDHTTVRGNPGILNPEAEGFQLTTDIEKVAHRSLNNKESRGYLFNSLNRELNIYALELERGASSRIKSEDFEFEEFPPPLRSEGEVSSSQLETFESDKKRNDSHNTITIIEITPPASSTDSPDTDGRISTISPDTSTESVTSPTIMKGSTTDGQSNPIPTDLLTTQDTSVVRATFPSSPTTKKSALSQVDGSPSQTSKPEPTDKDLTLSLSPEPDLKKNDEAISNVPGQLSVTSFQDDSSKPKSVEKVTIKNVSIDKTTENVSEMESKKESSEKETNKKENPEKESDKQVPESEIKIIGELNATRTSIGSQIGDSFPSGSKKDQGSNTEEVQKKDNVLKSNTETGLKPVPGRSSDVDTPLSDSSKENSKGSLKKKSATVKKPLSKSLEQTKGHQLEKTWFSFNDITTFLVGFGFIAIIMIRVKYYRETEVNTEKIST